MKKKHGLNFTKSIFLEYQNKLMFPLITEKQRLLLFKNVTYVKDSSLQIYTINHSMQLGLNKKITTRPNKNNE